MSFSTSPRLTLPRRSDTAGFTLIELLAVMVIIAILSTALLVGIPIYLQQANDTACQANLRKIPAYFLQLRAKEGAQSAGPPREGGVALLAYLWQKEAMEHTQTNAKTLTCPALDLNLLDAWIDLDTGELVPDPEKIWGTTGTNKTSNLDLRRTIRQSGAAYSSYRVIDLSGGGRWEKVLSGKTPIAADGDPLATDYDGEGDPEMNHDGYVFVVYGDQSIDRLDPNDIPELADLEGWDRYRLVGEEAEHSNGKFKNLVFNPAPRN